MRNLALGFVFSLTTFWPVWGESAQVEVLLQEKLGPLEIDRMALGQGGLSEEPMWDNRIAEIRALRPRMIRLFIQEYFDPLPERGRYHFDLLDRSVDTILQAGAEPLMCICFKPAVLFPVIDQDISEPNDYDEWERLIMNLVRHYKERSPRIRYWEVCNEPDIGEGGGCPSRFTPKQYVNFYRHTVAAILKADPGARVGGPALANVRSPILPALLEICVNESLPLHFVSWHIYSSNPLQIRKTIEYVKELLRKHPSLQPETILNEWNLDLGTPPTDARFQPCFIAETIWHMIDSGLDQSSYYHIRDYHVSFERFSKFMSPEGTAFMTKWWNRRPQWDGLFDYQNTIRPSYFTFKLLSRLTGERLQLGSDKETIHGFATWDDTFRLYNVMIWNFSNTREDVSIVINDPPNELQVRPLVLDALDPNPDENARLKPLPPFQITKEKSIIELTFEPYDVRFWYFEP